MDGTDRLAVTHRDSQVAEHGQMVELGQMIEHGQMVELGLETEHGQENGQILENGHNVDTTDQKMDTGLDILKDESSRDSRQDKGDNPTEQDVVDLSCGIGNLRTKVLGKCYSNLYTFAVFIGISALFSEMVRSIIHVQLTSIEKQFNIDNSKAGLFDVAQRSGHLSTIVLAGHFAKKVHIPLVIGLSGVFQGFLLTVPAFLQFTDPYQLPVLLPAAQLNSSNSSRWGEQAKYMCDHTSASHNHTTPHSDTSETTSQAAFIAIMVVQAVKGITDTFHSSFLPTLYMDDNMVDKAKMGIFLGIQHIITDLASPIGKQINGIMTEIPIDLKETDLDPKDGRFVAAWWLAFLVFGLGLALVSFPLMLFPRHLVSKRQQQAALDNAVVTFAGGQVTDELVEHDTSERAAKLDQTEQTFSGSFKRKLSSATAGSRKGSLASFGTASSRRPSMFPPVVKPTERKVSLAGDLVFQQTITEKPKGKKEKIIDMFKDFPKAVFRLLRNPAYVLLVIDTTIFSISYAGTSIFRSVYMANEYNVPMSEVTLASGISTALGHVTGTVMSSYLTSRVSTRTGYLYIMMSSYLFTVIITPLYLVFGCSNQPVYGATGEFGRPVNTTDVCDCSTAKVLISCGDDGNNYLSPCHAGCTGVDGKIFTDCSLLVNMTRGTVQPGLCPTDCHTNFIIYTFLSGLQTIAYSMTMIPRKLIVLRIVDPRDRGFATSLFMFFFSVMAIPAPNLFGRVIDGTCLVWDGRFCSLYDRDQIRYFLSGLDVAVHVLVQLTFFIMLAIFKWEERKVRKQNKDGADSGGVNNGNNGGVNDLEIIVQEKTKL